MTREQLYQAISKRKVYDTHSHLEGENLGARDFWHIGEYFWFLRELQAAGYPANAVELGEEERINAYLAAFQATRNTTMNWVVRSIFQDLYGIEIRDAQSIYQADQAVRSSSNNPEWASTVANRLTIAKVVVNRQSHVDFKGMAQAGVLVPRIDGLLKGWLEQIDQAEDQAIAGASVSLEIDNIIAEYHKKGCRGIMTTMPQFELATYVNGDELQSQHNSRDLIFVYILHRICQSVTKNGMFLQFFLGVESGWSSTVTAVNDPKRIVKLHGLFDQYQCKFQLVTASEINNLDVVQAARIFPNVYVGGLWWFNFRVSTYRESMQRRIEALPPLKCSLVVSDARCIEWCYGKILLIKRLLADFLFEQIESGWLDSEDALRVADAWLYGSAEDLVQPFHFEK